MTHALRVAVVLLLVLPVRAAQSTSPTAPVVEDLVGRWEGRGTILGGDARVEAEWTRVLEGRFIRLTWTSVFGPPPSQRFEGHAYYRIEAPDRLRATWYDSTGQIRPIEATVQAGTLTARWGTPETEVGETTYRLEAGRLEIVDRVRGRTGEWREFGRSVLTRVDRAPDAR